MFNWNDLTFFLAVQRQGHLAGAAERLRVDHTTVSRRIRELEQALNCKLFSRTRNGFILTDAGHKLLIYAEAIESNVHEINDEVGQTAREAAGSVRVATMEGLGSLYLSRHMVEFRQLFPSIDVELVTSPAVINLTKREADISMSFPRPRGRRVSARKIGEFRLFLYASKDYLAAEGIPGARTDLTAHRFADYVDDLVQINEVRWLNDVLPAAPIVYRSSSLIAQFQFAAAGGGIAMLPSFVGARDSNLVALLPEQVSVTRDLWIGVHEDQKHIRRIDAVSKYLTRLIESDQPFLKSGHPGLERPCLTIEDQAIQSPGKRRLSG